MEQLFIVYLIVGWAVAAYDMALADISSLIDKNKDQSNLFYDMAISIIAFLIVMLLWPVYPILKKFL